MVECFGRDACCTDQEVEDWQRSTYTDKEIQRKAQQTLERTTAVLSHFEGFRTHPCMCAKIMFFKLNFT